MKALVKFAPGQGNVDIREVDEPRCGDTQLKIEVAYCGICGTDLHVLNGTFRSYPPVILGHELAGTVVEVGRKVTGIAPGRRVAILGATAVTCGECRYCRSGDFIFCAQRKGMGHGVDGGFTRYVLSRPDQAYPIPPEITLEEAAMTEPFAAAARAVTEISQVRKGETALVSGPGPMGLLCLKLLTAADVKTVVIGAPGDEDRLNTALGCGAAGVHCIGAGSVEEFVRRHTGGEGVDAAFECAGHPGSVRNCLESLRPMGRYTQVAICGREIPFPIDQVFYKQLTLSGSICYTARTWERVMQIYAEGRVRLNDLITAKLPLTDWRHAFQLCESKQAVKVLLYPEA